MSRLPIGTVTFLFTDIEGSTRLLQRLGTQYAEVLTECRRLLRAAFHEHGGHEVDARGEEFFVAFSGARDAVAAAVAGQRAIAAHAWPEGITVGIRMGLHTGEPQGVETGYVGMDVHRAARICAAGPGGQILLSETTQALVAQEQPEGVSLRDLGEHRLKDLTRHQRLFQLVAPGLASDFPPLLSLDVLPNNLPVQMTSFVGREQEMSEATRLMRTTRLLTLGGIGGSGKTRLALQIAADLLQEFENGVWLVDLAPLTEPAVIPHAMASALSIGEQRERPVVTVLTDYLRTKHVLLVLDNCEHLIAACAQLADTLLRSCLNLRILATSREPLGIAGETAFPVPSLTLPDSGRQEPVDSLMRYDAMRLFVDRATAALPAFRLTGKNSPAVAEICARLDGNPLAIELAAARVKVLSPEEIAQRLDDRFRLLTGGTRTSLARHQTLRAAMDWSYDLLPGNERLLLRRLSVFAGGFTLEAAEGICSGGDVEPVDVLDLLTRLVEKSLVIVQAQDGPSRYQLQETVRQYGLGRLLESGEVETVRRRHRDYYLELTELAEPEILGPDQLIWLDRLETEHDNLRAALEWSERAQDDTEAGLRLATALWWFWQVRGYISEGRRWLEGALAATADRPSSSRTKALPRAGFFAWLQGDHQRASALSDESLRQSRESGDKRGEALSLLVLGFVAKITDQGIALLEESLRTFREVGDRWGTALALFNLAAFLRNDIRRVKALLDESLRLFREVRDKWGIAFALNNLGAVMRDVGDYARARPLLEESLALRTELSDRWGIADTQNALGVLARYQGDYTRAAALHEDSVAIFRDLGTKGRLAQSLRWLALVAHDQGDYDRTTALLNDVLSLYQELGMEGGVARTLGDLGLVAQSQGDTRRAKVLFGESLSRLAATGDEWRISWCLERLARLTKTEESPERAARLIGAAERLRERIDAPVARPSQDDYDGTVAAVRERLGESTFKRICVEGRTMTVDQAVEYALKEDK